ncbi:hypothetical protein Tco_0004860 [Tanacetum coccineum]
MDIESHYLLRANLSVVHTSLEPQVMLASKNPKKRAGRKIFKETRHPIYRGVRSRKFGKWGAVAVLAMRGPSACLNFVDSVWRLPIPQSSDVIDIQKAAAEAAKAFRPKVEIAKIVYDVDEDEIFGMRRVIDSFCRGTNTTVTTYGREW